MPLKVPPQLWDSLAGEALIIPAGQVLVKVIPEIGVDSAVLSIVKVTVDVLPGPTVSGLGTRLKLGGSA